MRFLKILIALSVIFCSVSVGVFFLKLTSYTKSVADSIQSTAQISQITLQQTNATMSDLRRTVQIAGGTLNVVRDTLRDEKTSIQAVNQKTIETMDNLNQLAVDLTKNLNTTAESIPPVMAQTQETVAQIGSAVQELQVLETQLQPTIQNINTTSANLAESSKAVNQMVQNAVKPQPWYRKAINYAVLPLKISSWFLQ